MSLGTVNVPNKGKYGLYNFTINEEGHLILGYEGDEPPAFSIEDDGHLYFDVPPKLDLGRVVADAYPLDFFSYEGVNIKEKFAGEMDFTDPWVWIQQRLAAQNLSGLHIKDWFEVEAKGTLHRMQIGAINHDLGFADTEITAFHIDFISKDLWPERHAWNKVTYNNGLSTEASPWLCSDLKAWLNSEKSDVPNEVKANPQLASVDYSATGVYDKLPASLQDVIVERRSNEPGRFSASGLLTDDNTWAGWRNIGKLWIPNETEVFNQIVCGTRNGYSIGETHQFPIFMDAKMRIKHLGAGGPRYTWWLRTAVSGNSANATTVDTTGFGRHYSPILTSIGVPICFRISG